MVKCTQEKRESGIFYHYLSRGRRGMGISMKIVIKSQGTMAIYEQIVTQLKNGIISGELKPGEAMPSIRRLASDLEVSAITTKRAYEELEKEGLVRSVAGKGFYVCEANQDYLREKQLLMLESRMREILEECRRAGLSQEDVLEMVEVLYGRE